jgi:hypothetical protein
MRVVKSVTIKLKRPTYIVLAEVPSNDPKVAKPYKIYLDKHNMVCCTCKGWRYRHACSHLTNFRSALAAAAERV